MFNIEKAEKFLNPKAKQAAKLISDMHPGEISRHQGVHILTILPYLGTAIGANLIGLLFAYKNGIHSSKQP